LYKEGKGRADEELEKVSSEETKHGGMVLPDLSGSSGWGPLSICVVTKIVMSSLKWTHYEPFEIRKKLTHEFL
jgi:phosphopantetheine adenylyltransferase